MQPSFLSSACSPTCPFPLNNLPYGAFTPVHSSSTPPALCVAIGAHVLNLPALVSHFPHLFSGPHLPLPLAQSTLSQPILNPFLALGKPAWLELRALLRDLLAANPAVHPQLRDADDAVRNELLPSIHDVQLHLPISIGDYTDFYSSEHHARNVGTMFRGPQNALPPNWRHMPIGYHGRASSVVVSGTPVRRPCGQVRREGGEMPAFAPSRLLDFELEMAAVVGGGENGLGERIGVDEAGERVFGFCLMNDWSARDVQKWEYVPLGPFGGKNFATSVAPWIVPVEALEEFARRKVEQRPEVLGYLKGKGGRADCVYDVELEVKVQTERGEKASTVCESNFKHMYWTTAQQLAHHSVTGCNMRAGDIIASGTISGPDERSLGSMLELSWKGTRKVELENCDGETRTFLQDGDSVYMYGRAQGEGFTIGFGECMGKIMPALE